MKTIHQLAITIAISVFSSAAFAATQTVNGLSWTYIVSNNVAIVGNGNTTAISESSEANIRHLVVEIPQKLGGYPVGGINKEAFHYLKVSGAIIPTTVTFIGEAAFRDNSFLKTVEGLNNVRTIGRQAFQFFC